MANTAVHDAIQKLSRLFAEQPERASSQDPPATAILEEGLRTQVTGRRGERVATDMVPALGGGGSAPSPGWLLRAAMASCTATAIAVRAAVLGISLDTLEVGVHSESDTRGLLGLDGAPAPCSTSGWR